MELSAEQLDELARSLVEARREHRFHPRPSELGVSLSIDHAYAIQMRQRELVVATDPERAIKLGLTTLDQRADAGFDGPSFGFLTQSMLIAEGGQLSLSRGLAPKVEPEIVAVIGEEIDQVPTTRQELLSCIRGIHAGIEVVDSRYQSGGFVLTDALADNSSAHAAVWATQGLPADSANWAECRIELEIDGQIVARGSGGILMGDPLRVVHEVIAERLSRGFGVPEGLAVFTGNAAPPAVALRPGNRVTARFEHLGSVSLDVVE